MSRSLVILFLTSVPSLVFAMPSVPVVVSPLDGEELTSAPVRLVVENSNSSTGETLTYDFEDLRRRVAAQARSSVACRGMI